MKILPVTLVLTLVSLNALADVNANTVYGWNIRCSSGSAQVSTGQADDDGTISYQGGPNGQQIFLHDDLATVNTYARGARLVVFDDQKGAKLTFTRPSKKASQGSAHFTLVPGTTFTCTIAEIPAE